MVIWHSSANCKSDLHTKYKMIADDGDEDDMEEPVTKKPKRSDSDSSSKIGRKSRKVITKVNRLFSV